MKTMEEIRKLARDELKYNLSNPLVSNERHDWLLDCLRVLGEDFCLTSVSSLAHIEVSPGAIIKVMEAFDTIEKDHDLWDITRGLQDKIKDARLKCDAIIALYREKEGDEKAALKERIEFDEDIRLKCRRY